MNEHDTKAISSAAKENWRNDLTKERLSFRKEVKLSYATCIIQYSRRSLTNSCIASDALENRHLHIWEILFIQRLIDRELTVFSTFAP